MRIKKKSKIIILFLVIASFLVFYFLFYKKQAIKTEEPLIQVSSFKKNYKLENLRGRLGSFTEGFSGSGWKNREKTSVYHDSNSLNISFPVKYEFKSIANPFE